MDQELKTWLAGMESRLLAHVDGVGETFRAQIEQSEERSRAHTEIVETCLLKEFSKWARTTDARYRQNQAVVSGLDIRVPSIEDRLSDLEQNSSQ